MPYLKFASCIAPRKAILRVSWILLAALVPAGISVSAQTIPINRDNPTIAISASDEASATADTAAVSIGFDLYDADADAATASAGRISHAILEALHKAGVEDKAIESRSQSLNRNMAFDDKDSPAQRAKKQFHFEQSWEVAASPANASEVLRQAMGAGANQSGQIEWKVSDRKGLQAKAAANALIRARAVASQMAEGLGVKLGPLLYASNQAPEVIRPLGAPRAMMMAKGAPAPPPPPLEIRPQTIHEEATVYAVFAIE